MVVLRCGCSFSYIEYPLMMLSLNNKTTLSNLSECINIHVRFYIYLFELSMNNFFFFASSSSSFGLSARAVCILQQSVFLFRPLCISLRPRVGGYCFPKWIYDKIIDKYRTIIPDYKYKNTSISFFLL